MSSERLLKRMAQWQNDRSTSTTVDITDRILADVEQLLNVQRGNVLIDNEMGLPDMRTLFHSHAAPDVDNLAEQIKQQITAYEHRIGQVQIIKDDEEESEHLDGLHWVLRAEHSGRAGDWFEADINVDVGGKLKVRAKI